MNHFLASNILMAELNHVQIPVKVTEQLNGLTRGPNLGEHITAVSF